MKMQASDVKTREDFECLMKERAGKFKAENPETCLDAVPGIGCTISTEDSGAPDTEFGKRVLCEMNRLAMAFEDVWVECGPVWYDDGFRRNVMIYFPFKENITPSRCDLEFLLYMNIRGKRPPECVDNWAHAPPNGSFCSVKGGCL